MGAVSFFGIKNWKRIDSLVEQFVPKDQIETLDCGNCKVVNECEDALVIVTSGFYSNLQSEETQYKEQEWIDISLKLRIYHEITHVICRKKYKEMIEPIWDEIVADYMGMQWAIGKYDMEIAAKCLGVYDEEYKEGGRLENYVKNKEEVYDLFQKVKKTIRNLGDLDVKEGEERWDVLDRIQGLKGSIF